jgi:hypothetical protein
MAASAAGREPSLARGAGPHSMPLEQGKALLPSSGRGAGCAGQVLCTWPWTLALGCRAVQARTRIMAHSLRHHRLLTWSCAALPVCAAAAAGAAVVAAVLIRSSSAGARPACPRSFLSRRGCREHVACVAALLADPARSLLLLLICTLLALTRGRRQLLAGARFVKRLVLYADC